jgi:flavin-binding protein dodecin
MRGSPALAVRARNRRAAAVFPTYQRSLERVAMPTADEHVYKVLELVGSSPASIEDAVQAAISRAEKTLRNVRWFEVTETRGHVQDGKVAHYQVRLKVGFTLDS